MENEKDLNLENLETVHVENTENDFDSLFNISAEDVKESLELLEAVEESENKNTKRKTTKHKKSISEIADETVNNYLADRSDKNWKKLQELFWYGIKQFALKYVKNQDDAYDMTIETFINAHEKIDRYDPTKAKFSTWLWVICRNICLGHIRNQSKENVVDKDISEVYDSALFPTPFASSINDNDYVIDKNGSLKQIDNESSLIQLYNTSINEIKNIGGITQKILEMKLIDDMKIREIADILNMHESTVKNHLYKGKTNLARILKINHKDLYENYIDANANIDDQCIY